MGYCTRPATTYQYSIIRGTAFTEVPDYPYDLVFVDGPELTVHEGEYSYETANMDFIRYMLKATKPVTAIVDCRPRTCLVYGMVFGKNKVKLLRPWLTGVVENVTKEDMILNNGGQYLWQGLSQTVQVLFDDPSWLKNKI